ncbi:major capsid protein [Deefgea piscis]|uniref:major capsid protein n=1 Tax=Deefgea piscis TaxID=2739061 RepID=UPI001C7FAE15|nr:major capsid protein [Deefgea piscis]QZA80241.1 major capsid protein [Deefgea piscis]
MDIFNTAVLGHVVAALPLPSNFLLSTFFPFEQRETTEEIHFEVEGGRRRMAPFVSPLVAGKVVGDNGRVVNSLKPAYIKDKRRFDPSAPLRRALGETIGGNYTPEQRIQINLRTSLADQIKMVNRRLEWMAKEVLLYGKVTIVGDNYPAALVDFQRDPALRVVKGAGTKWTDGGVNPLDDLQAWALLVLQKSGAYPDKVVLDPDAWKVFRNNAAVKERWNSLNSNIATLTPAAAGEGGKYMGAIDGFEIYTYAEWFVDPMDDTEKAMFPTGSVVMSSSAGLEGYRAFGAIRDEESGYQALPYFSKSWLEKDPSVRWLLMQSAPLIVPYRVNASLSASVL